MRAFADEPQAEAIGCRVRQSLGVDLPPTGLTKSELAKSQPDGTTAKGEGMTEMQFTQALIVILLVALFAPICWLTILLNELTRTVRAAAGMMQDKLSANYEIFQQLVAELQDVRTAVTARDTKE
jgi:hypothetical protein